MKKLLFIAVLVSVMGIAMGQQVVNGVYQGSPGSFMYLPTTAPAGGWENSWVKPKRYADGDNFIATGGTAQPNMGTGATLGAVTTGSYTHRFVVTSDSTYSPSNDPCFRSDQALGYNNKPILAEAWNTDLYPGTFVDSVIQMGGSGGVTSGLHAQELLYSFVPDTNNPVLLLQFAFVTENALHSTYAPRNPGVEFAVLAHNTPNYLPLGYYPGTNKPYSQFFFGTPLGEGASGNDARNTPSPVMPYLVPKGNCQCSKDYIYTFPYVVVAFNLTEQARNHQAVDFRVREWACNASVHWAYCYFTAKMIPAKLQVKYCGGDTLFMSIPWGFDDATYRWYNGTDSAHVSYVDIDDPGNWVFSGSTSYRPKLRANPEKPYYRCEVVSRTGVPFTYEATVNYYLLRPSFTVEDKALTSEKNCDLGVVLHNTSEIGVVRPNGNGGVDTTWQNLELNPEQCTWDFGDGTPEVHGFEPAHIYAQPGTYTIKLHITDYERVCVSSDVDTTVTLLSEYMEKQYSADTATTCEGKLPYYYKPAIFGNDNVQTRWDLNAIGERQVNYSYALPQYHIRAWNGCDSIVKVQFDVLTPSVTIYEAGTYFCDSAATLLRAQLANVREDAVQYTWTFMDSVMSTNDEMWAHSDGTYSVNIIDMTTECEASHSYKIDPCVPNVFLPNCITPSESAEQFEGPVQNNYLYLDNFVLSFISDLKFMVYGRNGEQVYYYEGTKDAAGEFQPPTPYGDLPTEMNGRMVLWDGKVKGRVISGTYTYALWIVSGGQSYLYKGKLIVM